MDETRNILPQLREALRSRDFRLAKEVVRDLHPADAVELIADLDTTERIVVFRLLNKETAAHVFSDLSLDDQSILIELFTEQQTAALFEEMDPDDRADVLEELPAGVVKKILRMISPAEREMTASQISPAPFFHWSLKNLALIPPSLQALLLLPLLIYQAL